jgi:hypothetical protein
MTSTDRELQQWMDAWQAETGERTAPEAIRAHVRRRSLQLGVWLAGEIVVAGLAIAFVIRAALATADPVDRIAMALLAVIASGALALSWWNWRGTVRATARTTREFVRLSVERWRRLRRAIVLGWGLLAAEVLVLAPWVWHRLYGGTAPPSADAERFGWGLLVLLSTLAALLLGALHLWARREERRVGEMLQQIGE